MLIRVILLAFLCLFVSISKYTVSQSIEITNSTSNNTTNMISVKNTSPVNTQLTDYQVYKAMLDRPETKITLQRHHNRTHTHTHHEPHHKHHPLHPHHHHHHHMNGSHNSTRKYSLKVALIYWGLCRSTDKVLPSIINKIYKPLEEAGIKYHVYLHTYHINHSYMNVRSHEENVLLNNSLYKLLRPTKYIIQNQDEFDATVNFTVYRKHRDPWDNNYTTTNNFIRGLNSLFHATKLFLDSNITYDRVIFLRPDVRFWYPLQVFNWVVNISSNEIILPDFANYPINDRFAICYPHVARLIGLRYSYALKYSQKKELHSEGFLYDILYNNKIVMKKVKFIFTRVRATGLDEKNGRI